MVQLDILSGKLAGQQWLARRFPFWMGRAAQSALVLNDPGVWDAHAEFSIRPDEGIILSSHPESLTLLNGRKVEQAILRNGDMIEAGSVKMRFSLSATRQSSLRLREAATWVSLGLLAFGQVALIYCIAS